MSDREILADNFPRLKIVPVNVRMELRGELALVQCEEIVTHPSIRKYGCVSFV
jgi:hypothetical protein